MKSDLAEATLPNGLWVDGQCYREATLRSITGEDEAALIELRSSASLARQTTALLARCVTSLGPVPVDANVARRLTVGDREALLLHLRGLTLDERARGVLDCPSPTCREKLEVDIRIQDLLLPPYGEIRPNHETTLASHGKDYTVRFRLPVGEDQEAVASIALKDPTQAAGEILTRCIDSVTEADHPIAEVPSDIVEQMPEIIARLDPQAEVTLDIVCPTCGHRFSALLDAATFLFQELAGHTEKLFREVHLLAFHYHWSEGEILSMTPRRREVYLRLLAEALGAEGEG